MYMFAGFFFKENAIERRRDLPRHLPRKIYVSIESLRIILENTFYKKDKVYTYGGVIKETLEECVSAYACSCRGLPFLKPRLGTSEGRKKCMTKKNHR